MDRLTVHPPDASIKRLCLDSLNFALILSRFFELFSLLESVCSRRNRGIGVVLPLWACLRDVLSHYVNVKSRQVEVLSVIWPLMLVPQD